MAWLSELIEEDLSIAPPSRGYALGGAIGARFACDHSDRLGELILVDALGLTPFEPAPDFGLALHGFLAEPSEHTHEALWRHCALDLDRLRQKMGTGWDAFESYNLDRACTPSVQTALGELMEQFGGPAIDPAELERITVPTRLIWGRHDLARHGRQPGPRRSLRRPLQVIEDGRRPRSSSPRPSCAQCARPTARWLAAAGSEARSSAGGTLATTDGAASSNGMATGVRPDRPLHRCAGRVRRRWISPARRPAGLRLRRGHNVTGNAVVDDWTHDRPRPMKGIDITPMRAPAAPGRATWGELDAATRSRTRRDRRADVHHGLGGLVLGGGSGWTERQVRLLVDNLLSVRSSRPTGGC